MNGNPTKDNFNPTDMTIDLGYGIKIIDNLSAGVAGHFVSSKLGDGVSGSAVAFDLGVQYRLAFSEKMGLDLGLKAANIGSKLKYGEGEGSALPAKAVLGAMFTMQPSDAHSIKVGVDAGYKFMGNTGFVAGVGAEYMAFNTVAADGTVGIRIPMMDFCQQLVAKLGRPLVSTSANISGESTPARFAEISNEVKSSVDHIVDPSLEKGSTGQSSSIIKVGLDYSIEIIRK